ncbi:MAG: hypothetical protein MJK04_24155, partial [Psychrosphaera sp.]|nr:hypothetical protein [Psychrosphaera sp.]
MNNTYIRKICRCLRPFFEFNIRFFSLLIMLTVPTGLFAQSNQIRFEHVNQGLSQVTINCMLQDQQGFLWFGTQDGLNRYDGYRFEVFKHQPDNLNSLVNNHIQSLHQDKQGFLWIGTQGGLNQFNPKTANFTRFVHEPDHQPNNKQSLSHNNVLSIEETERGVLWIGTSAGLDQFDPTGQTFTHFSHDPQQQTSLSENNVNIVYHDSRGTLWVGTNNGLNKFNDQQQAFNHPLILTNHKIFALFEDNQAMLWIGTDQGLHRLSLVNDSVKSKGKLTSYIYDAQNPASISHNHIKAITQDDSGALWVGPNAGGLNK